MKKAISYIGRLFGGSLRPVLAVICGYAVTCAMCGIFSRLILSGVIPYDYIYAYSAASVFSGGAAAAVIFGKRGKIVFNSVLLWAVMMAGIIVLGAVFFEGGFDPHSAFLISAAALTGSLAGCILSNLR